MYPNSIIILKSEWNGQHLIVIWINPRFTGFEKNNMKMLVHKISFIDIERALRVKHRHIAVYRFQHFKSKSIATGNIGN